MTHALASIVWFNKVTHNMASKYNVKEITKTTLGCIAIVYSIGLLSFFIYDTIQTTRDQPRQEKLLKSLKIEFGLIKKMPDSKIEYEKYIAYTNKTSVDISYSTEVTDTEIQKFYSSELVKNGWRLVEQHKTYDWYRDLGGKSFTYTKSNLRLTVEYAGDRAGAGWAYDIYLGLKKDIAPIYR